MPVMTWSIKFELNLITGLSANVQKLLDKSGNRGNSAKHDQRLTRLVQSPNKFAHQIWAQSDQQFVWKLLETAGLIIGQQNSRNLVEHEKKVNHVMLWI